MKNKFPFLLIVIILVCAGILVTPFHFQTKKSSVSEQIGDTDHEKENSPKNDLMLWESLSSHLLSFN